MSQKTLEKGPCLLPLTVYFHFIPDTTLHLHKCILSCMSHTMIDNMMLWLYVAVFWV